MASIDRADWHYGGDYPENLPEENGGTHIGMYLSWIIHNDLIGDIHLKNSKEGLSDVKSKKITGRDFFYKYCDGKFWDEDLNSLGLQFTEFYYSNEYLKDYSKLQTPDMESIYYLTDDWDNFEILKPMIDKRFKTWNSRRTKKFWQFWK